MKGMSNELKVRRLKTHVRFLKDEYVMAGSGREKIMEAIRNREDAITWLLKRHGFVTWRDITARYACKPGLYQNKKITKED